MSLDSDCEIISPDSDAAKKMIFSKRSDAKKMKSISFKSSDAKKKIISSNNSGLKIADLKTISSKIVKAKKMKAINSALKIESDAAKKMISFECESKKMISSKKLISLKNSVECDTKKSWNRMIKLKSSDGDIFEVEEAVAAESLRIKEMIDDGWGVIPLPEVSSVILGKVIKYCRKHAEAKAKGPYPDPYEDADVKKVRKKFRETPWPTDIQIVIMMKIIDSKYPEHIRNLRKFDYEFVNAESITMQHAIWEAAKYLKIEGLRTLTNFEGRVRHGFGKGDYFHGPLPRRDDETNGFSMLLRKLWPN